MIAIGPTPGQCILYLSDRTNNKRIKYNLHNEIYKIENKIFIFIWCRFDMLPIEENLQKNRMET